MEDRGAETPQAVSNLALFLRTLMDEGRPAIATQPSANDDTDAMPLLEQMDSLAREALALEFPPFSPKAALWSARLMFQLCRFVVCREIPEEQIQTECAVACPEPRNPSTDWSVDLCLHHLPNLFRLARHLSNADPLVAQMKAIGAAWPLSSIGMPSSDAPDLSTFIHDPGLRRLYGDRVIAAGDVSRLAEPRVADLISADLGLHRELAPAFAAKLSPPA